ncbi:MAG: SCO family protein [Pseudomonadota bacterium]
MPSTAAYAFAAAFVAAGALGVGTWIALDHDAGFAECGAGVATGAASIGGPFTLTDASGARVTEAEVIDRPTLLYFGYTFCPDVCPIDAANMAVVDDMLAEEGHDVNTVFISVDPARDTPEVVGDFVANLHPDMRGLTGSEEDVAEAAKAYRVYYNKVDGDDPEFYLMDHSAFIYFVAPDHGFLDIFRHGEPATAIAERAACYLDALPEVELPST